MNQIKISAHEAALQVMEEAVKMLLQPGTKQTNAQDSAIARAKDILDWPASLEFQPLRLLFDKVKIQEEQPTETHYWPVQSIKSENSEYCPPIPYPVSDRPSNFDELQNELKTIKLANEDWQNLSLLTLIVEKYGSFISFGNEDISFCDRVRSTAALAAAIANNPEAKQLCLVAGDLSGIQNFIYTISADGALKSLRARSFYLELVTEEVVQQLLAELKLPRTSVIYAGGGNLYILAPGNEEQVRAKVSAVKKRFNHWLLKEFQGAVFLALDAIAFDIEKVKDSRLSKVWQEVPQKLAIQKQQKFSDNLHKLLKVNPSFSTPCKVCHRDDTDKLKPLSDESETEACCTCRTMYQLGDRLLKIDKVIRSTEKKESRSYFTLTLKFSDRTTYYYLPSQETSDHEKFAIADNDIVFLINNWSFESYKSYKNPVSLFLGQYGRKSEQKQTKKFNTTMRAEEFASKATGIDRIGYLRMDVDNLGQIFAKGLGDDLNLPRLASLSRMMTYFFKVYLNSLAENREKNTSSFKTLTKSSRQNLLFIYAGGDDLFISGAWDEVVEFSCDIYQSFRAYTGHNPSITLSGGVSLATMKYPLYQAASESGEMEEKAKGNGKDSLGLFGQTFKWAEWLGYDNKEKVLDRKTLSYLQSEIQPEILGILPFVERLNTGGIDYPRSFVRNLLNTADLQEKAIEEAEKKFAKDSDRIKDCRYFLHLPKVAYTLSRLPQRFKTDRPLITSLKNPHNATYFRAIATWIELLNRKSSNDK